MTPKYPVEGWYLPRLPRVNPSVGGFWHPPFGDFVPLSGDDGIPRLGYPAQMLFVAVESDTTKGQNPCKRAVFLRLLAKI